MDPRDEIPAANYVEKKMEITPEEREAMLLLVLGDSTLGIKKDLEALNTKRNVTEVQFTLPRVENAVTYGQVLEAFLLTRGYKTTLKVTNNGEILKVRLPTREEYDRFHADHF